MQGLGLGVQKNAVDFFGIQKPVGQNKIVLMNDMGFAVKGHFIFPVGIKQHAVRIGHGIQNFVDQKADCAGFSTAPVAKNAEISTQKTID